MDTAIISTFLINSLFIFGLYAVTGKNMIFGSVQRWKLFKPRKTSEESEYFIGMKVETNEGDGRNEMFKKPLFNCPPCMASIWGTGGFLFTGLGWEYWVVWVLSLAGFNYIVNKVLER